MPTKKWRLLCESEATKAEIDGLCGELGILNATARLLWQRGYRDAASAGEFIRCEDNIFHDPFLLCDMKKAVDRILKARETNEKVMIYGDYDVDGVTSVSVLYLYLKSVGIDCSYHIPSRSGEGYGISLCAIDSIYDSGYSLIVSVDTGITAVTEIAYAKEKNIDTIVTDHHECHGEIPCAEAVVNPWRPDCTYPFKELAGVGVVFKLITAIEMKLHSPENAYRTICNEYADLIACGTVADVMPLIDENRLIVSMGLKKMEMSPRIGIEALLRASGIINDIKNKRINSSTIGYFIAPRINAAGRLSDASIAVELMLSSDSKKADELAQVLCEINARRKEEENVIAKEALDMIPDDYDFDRYPVIVLARENWHHGIIGIVASRLTDKYGFPSILISFDENGMGKGSGRSVKGLNLVEALSSCSDALVKFGGHELAAGLSVDKAHFEEFRERINEYARNNFNFDTDSICTSVDLVLDKEDITLCQAEELYLLEPYGTANPAPVFVLCDATITELCGIGSNKHIRMNITKGAKSFSAIYFGMSPELAPFSRGDVCDIVFSLDVNDFRGVKSIQLNVKKVLPSYSVSEKRYKQKELYEAINSGLHYSVNDDIYPHRREFAALYTYIKNNSKNSTMTYMQSELLCVAVNDSPNAQVKLEFMLAVFSEMGLFTVVRHENEYNVRYDITLKFVRGKVNLDKSIILRNLKLKQDRY